MTVRYLSLVVNVNSFCYVLCIYFGASQLKLFFMCVVFTETSGGILGVIALNISLVTESTSQVSVVYTE